MSFAFRTKQEADLLQTVQQLLEASYQSSLLLLLPSQYPPNNFSFISLRYIFADHLVVPELHDNS